MLVFGWGISGKKQEIKQSSNVYYLCLLLNIHTLYATSIYASCPQQSKYFKYIVSHNPLICCSYFSGLTSLLHCMWVISWLLQFMQSETRLQWKEQFVGMAFCRYFFINLKNTVKIFLDKKNLYTVNDNCNGKLTKSTFALLALIWNLEVFQLCLSYLSY